jgi:hypothetical protein
MTTTSGRTTEPMVDGDNKEGALPQHLHETQPEQHERQPLGHEGPVLAHERAAGQGHDVRQNRGQLRTYHSRSQRCGECAVGECAGHGRIIERAIGRRGVRAAGRQRSSLPQCKQLRAPIA